ncbi:MAG: ABC transporter permease [Micrococcales bacterium]|nr:ABC transporter permease [Micrococcales bacterium]
MMQRWWLVASREIKTQMRSTAYRVSFFILVLVGFGGAFFGGWAANNSEIFSGGSDQEISVAVVGELPAAAVQAGLKAVPVEAADDQAAAKQAVALVEDGSVEAAILVGGAGDRDLAIALEEMPDQVVDALTVTPQVEILQPPAISPALRMIATVGCGILFFAVVMMFGQIAAQNTVVEKQTRVVEILLTAVPARSLMAGKVLGNAVLAFAQVAAMLIAVLVAVVMTGWSSLLGALSWSVVWFLVLFLVGFVLFSSLLAGTAALVSRIEDVSAVIFPVLLLAMVPYFLVIYSADSESMQRVLSFVPVSSPMAMPARLLLGSVAWWEPFVALLILIGTTYLAILLGGKLYQGSLLRMGARVKWGEAFKAAD